MEKRQELTLNGEIFDNFDPWMIVGKRPRRVDKRKEKLDSDCNLNAGNKG